jgi:hypothetical protein
MDKSVKPSLSAGKAETGLDSVLRPVRRLKDKAALMRAAQEAALDKWNADKGRPQWGRDGAMLRHVSPGPVDLDSLYYLANHARSSLREWAERGARYQKAERAAIENMRDLSVWLQSARKTLAMLHPTDVGGGPGIFALQRLLADANGRPCEIALVAAPFAGARLNRIDDDRSVLVIDVAAMLTRAGRVATRSELAWASVLCGFFPISLKHNSHGHTAAEAIDAERRIIVATMKRINMIS